jgi:hypothetical protein
MSSQIAITKYLEQVKNLNQKIVSPETASINTLSSVEGSVLVSASSRESDKGGSVSILSGNSKDYQGGDITFSVGKSPAQHGLFSINGSPNTDKTVGGYASFLSTNDQASSGQSVALKGGGSLHEGGKVVIAGGDLDQFDNVTPQDITDFSTQYGVPEDLVGGDVEILAGNAYNLFGKDGFGGNITIKGGSNNSGATTDYGKIEMSTGSSTNASVSGKINLTTGNGPESGEITLTTGNGFTTKAGDINLTVGATSNDSGSGHITLRGGGYLNTINNGNDSSAGEVRVYGGKTYQSNVLDTALQGGRVVIEGGEVEVNNNQGQQGWKGGTVLVRGGQLTAQAVGTTGDVNIEGHTINLQPVDSVTLTGDYTYLNATTVQSSGDVFYIGHTDNTTIASDILNIDSDTINLNGTNPSVTIQENLTMTGNGLSFVSSIDDFNITSPQGNINIEAGTAGTGEEVRFNTTSIPVDDTDDKLNNRLAVLMNDGVLSALGVRIVGAGVTQIRITQIAHQDLEILCYNNQGSSGDGVRSSYTGEDFNGLTVGQNIKVLFSIEILDNQNFASGDVTIPYYRFKVSPNSGSITIRGQIDCPLATPANPCYVTLSYVLFELTNSSLIDFPNFD